ncbi:MAG: hypothetical protein KH156_12425 [Alistipes sp.]|jgi:hypothetical protein|nr:hypothetical protein [Alistipes sp.]
MQKIIIPIISLMVANIAIKDTVVKSWIGKPYTMHLFNNELVYNSFALPDEDNPNEFLMFKFTISRDGHKYVTIGRKHPTDSIYRVAERTGVPLTKYDSIKYQKFINSELHSLQELP